jgi:serine/threonine protein kinase
MATPATTNDFLAVARKSQQIDTSRLDAYLRAKRGKMPAEPRKLAAQLVRAGVLTTFQAEQFLLGKHKGFLLGGYRVIDRLGSGGTGTVYLAEHQVMRRRVALKVLPAAYAEDRAVLERFRREAQAAAALDHPNVIHVYDFRQEGPLYFIVLEYIEGPNLQQILARRGPLPIPVACDYIQQAALGLHHAHAIGMIHRDIKPANIVVDVWGTVKVLDLGLARYDDGRESSLTKKFNSNHVLGTADYLAPEQALDLHDVDGRADIYGLGASLYALLAGRPPFHKGTIGQKLMWHQTKEPEPVKDVRPEVPASLSAIVARMLAKNPGDRFPTAEAVAEALEPWAAEAQRGDPRLGPRSGSMAGPGSGRAPKPRAADTWVARSDEDTTKIKPPNGDETIPARSTPTAPVPALWKEHRIRFLVGITAVVIGLVAGVFAALQWGPQIAPKAPAPIEAKSP